MKNLDKLRLLQAALIILLGLLVLVTIWNVHLIQGTARVINGVGFTGGGAQRLVKLEMIDRPNRELENRIDTVLKELRDGGEADGIIVLSDAEYKECLNDQIELWEKLKKEIHITREKGYASDDIVDVSEEYFRYANDTVNIAEEYADIIAQILAVCEYTMATCIIGLVILSLMLHVSTNKATKAYQELIKYQAERDGLTDLLNRRMFQTYLEKYEKSDKAFSLHIVDIDYFKQFNDSYGHNAGDEILKNVAHGLKSGYGSSSYIFRIGGDEFAVIMPNTHSDSKDSIGDAVTRMAEFLKNSYREEFGITLSIGIAFSETVEEGGSIFEAADCALYYVKDHGRDGLAFYDEIKNKCNETENN